ncbi:THIOM protein, partial [Drymodes brunneopygia]|nr:THIOM protein [Drymodes brunneopygia]
MAQRLVFQRLLSLPARGPLASHGRAFATSAARRSTFNVQDGSDFQDRVVNSPKPVVVDFHAHSAGLFCEWTSYCRAVHAQLPCSHFLRLPLGNQLQLGSCRLCSPVSLFLLPQVSAVPTVLAMKNGDVVDKFVGVKDEDQLEAFLKKLIGA